MKIKLDHINLTVADIQSSVDWYAKIFGFRLVEKGVGSYGQNWAIIASNDCMIAMNEYKDKSPADHEPETAFHRMYHFGVRVSDLKEWEKIVRQNKLELYYGGVISYPFSRSWYIHDPSGHEIDVSYTDGPELRFPKDYPG